MRVRDGRGSRRDGGQAALEYVGVVTLLLFVALAALQLGIVAYTVQQAGTAARAAARAATYRETRGDSYQAAGQAAMSGWLDGRFSETPTGTGIEVTARVHIPALIPLFDFGDATRSVTMPLDTLPGTAQGVTK
ncbi:TadE/TadG family type IV pilus assembly protein [Streptomyces sp. NRRL F-5126]|uniref:TadE/TadG family type IV pilus assembly protein n=1 Tax=Streptomyces sp. NRRL F-5126 TaxID=1463857 RepID=UPI0006914E8D|nr:TadE/TadG family type IV pilus assembly protein [Streptomyces sp. NRRL F-5126]